MRYADGFGCRYSVTKNGEVFNTWTTQFLKPLVTRGGHPIIRLSHPTMGQRAMGLARLVLATYRPVHNMHELYACHEDGDSMNCALDNLYWGNKNGSLPS